MAQQGNHMRFGACEGFAYRSVKLVILANSNRYEVDSNMLFSEWGSPLNILNIALQTKTFFFFYTDPYL
jgi:hypothetical protein